jgi:2-methylcitrate dehydratase PrpD
MYATEILARGAAQLHQRPLQPQVLHHARRALIDWYASVYPGLPTPPVRLLADSLHDDLGHGAARLVDGRAATPRAAALIHGTAAHAAEVDDSFRDAMYHPGAATIASALAAAQSVGADGARLLRGIVSGYEVSTRIGVVMGRAHYKYWHSTGTVGTFGAAAAAASLLDLDEVRLAHALATAATFAAGLQQAFRMDSMSKPLHAGRAAEAGLLAAMLAARGVTGSLDVLDGESGFGRAMSTGPDWSHVGDTLGQDFHITRLTFKNHIGCGHTFPAIDGALVLRAGHALKPEEIERVHVATYKPALDIACYSQPANANEARFSLPFVVATALVHGSVRLAAYEADRLADPQVRALMPRIVATVDPGIDAGFPGRRSALVEIVLKDGRKLRHVQADRKGDPEDPLADGELQDKLLELATPVIGEPAVRALLGRIASLDAASSLP